MSEEEDLAKEFCEIVEEYGKYESLVDDDTWYIKDVGNKNFIFYDKETLDKAIDELMRNWWT